MLAARKARSAGERYDASRAVPFCQKIDDEWRAAYEKSHPLPPATHWQRLKWRLGLDHAGFFRRTAQVAPCWNSRIWLGSATNWTLIMNGGRLRLRRRPMG